MTWQINGCDRQLKDSMYLRIPGRNGRLHTVDYYGKKEALIRGGIVTEKMLHLEPIDNGFGITEDEYGNHMYFVENYSGPGVYRITLYLHSGDLSVDEKEFLGRTIDGVDVDPIINQLRYCSRGQGRPNVAIVHARQQPGRTKETLPSLVTEVIGEAIQHGAKVHVSHRRSPVCSVSNDGTDRRTAMNPPWPCGRISMNLLT